MERLRDDVQHGRLRRTEPGRMEEPHWSSPLVCSILQLLAQDGTYRMIRNIHVGANPEMAEHRDLWRESGTDTLWTFEADVEEGAHLSGQRTTGEWRKLGATRWFVLDMHEDLEEIRGDDRLLTHIPSRREIHLRSSEEWPLRYMREHLRRYMPRNRPPINYFGEEPVRITEGAPGNYHFFTLPPEDREQDTWFVESRAEWRENDPTRRQRERAFARHGETAVYIVLRVPVVPGEDELRQDYHLEILSGPYTNMREAMSDIDTLHRCHFTDAFHEDIAARTFISTEFPSACNECYRPRGYIHQRKCSQYRPV